MPADLAFSTASSFTTNTNWQAYGGESTMSYLTQMAGLAWHNFISVGVGIGVMMALARGLTYRLRAGRAEDARQFLGRSESRHVIYLLIPFSIVMALVLVWQGVLQNFSSYIEADNFGGSEANSGDGAGGVAG